jgi:UDP-N-acetylglucosamine 2-epimerase (non-hydrolysing)
MLTVELARLTKAALWDSNKMKIMILFGTRPEAIKLASLINHLKRQNEIAFKVCVTAQHRGMLDQVLEIFDIPVDYDLNLMREGQDLFDITVRILSGLKGLLLREEPDIVVVQGDTTTTMASSVAAFYAKIKIAHVEAGLRTEDKYSPFPEEINRRITSCLADFHFCPTETAKANLLKEGTPEKKIFVTGNTVIDALYIARKKLLSEENKYLKKFSFLKDSRKLLLVTGHRRENFGEGFSNICQALREIGLQYKNRVHIVYPVHLNPNVQEPVHRILGSIENVHLIPPQDYMSFLYLMNKSYFIITDSGGIQEEAPALGKPVLVIRTKTERTEGIDAGTAKLIGTDRESIKGSIRTLLENDEVRNKMSQCASIFGDGKAAERILRILSSYRIEPISIAN